MKILVTGGAGYLGSITCSALIDNGHTPIILDSLSTGNENFVKGRLFYKGDIADRNIINRIFLDHPEIECCIHFAARIIIPESVKNPYLYYSENVSKTIVLFNELRNKNIKKVIFSSSASIYDTATNYKVDENSPVNPKSPYARSKYCVEMILEDFCNANYFKGICFRYFNPIGADIKLRSGGYAINPTHILGKLLSVKKNKNSSFNINGTDWPTKDGTAIRDYFHVWDLAIAHVMAVEQFDKVFSSNNSNYCLMNLGGGKATTVKEFVKSFENVVGYKINTIEADRRPGDVVGAFAKCNKANTILNWKPKFTIEDAIQSAILWEEKLAKQKKYTKK